MDDDYTSIEDYFSNEVYLTHSSDYEELLSNNSRPELSPRDPTELVLMYAFNAVIVATGIVLNLVLVKGIIGAKPNESATESLTEENNYEVATDAISQKRSLTIDYRYKKRRISVRLPILLVWFIAASESLPLFLFADIETLNSADSAEQPIKQYCTELTNTVANHNIVSLMVIAIRIILPSVALVITLAQTQNRL
uniref:G-protein coupled receptors family 1 profile domain-containing protein n=1 Tax=Anopheles merus TaxID=30066 RepID=A0A182UUQ5_ANOME